MKASDVALEGGCLCGGFRYRLRARPVALGDCHCVDCRRASGAPYVTWGSVDRPQYEIVQGTLRPVSHAGRVRSFAACCGTPVLFEDEPGSATVDVAIATLDDPVPFGPRKAIWLEDRLPWVPLDPSVPGFVRSSGAG